jgi:hypothetical protein
MLSISIDILEFFSFWLVAPEFLGERRLKAAEKAILKAEPLLPGLSLGFLGLMIGLFFGRFSKFLSQFQGWNFIVLGVTALVIIAVTFFSKQISNFLANKVFSPFFLRLSENGQTRNFLLKTGISFFCLSFFLKMISHLYF